MGNEKTYIKQVKSRRNEAAANALISLYYREIYGYIYKQVWQKELALDLTQEVFISMLKSIDSFDERKASFRTWLYKITTNRIVDFYRSKYYRESNIAYALEESDVAGEADFTSELEQREDVEAIGRIIGTFEPMTQQLFRLKFYSDYTFREIADVLKVPESTVKTKYYASVRKIKKTMEETNHGQG